MHRAGAHHGGDLFVAAHVRHVRQRLAAGLHDLGRHRGTFPLVDFGDDGGDSGGAEKIPGGFVDLLKRVGLAP